MRHLLKWVLMCSAVVATAVNSRGWDQPAPGPLAEFRDWAEAYRSADPDDRQRMIDDGIRLARARRAAMLDLIIHRPQEALAQAVPASMRGALPEAVEVLLEERISGVGDLVVLSSAGNGGSDAAADFGSRWVYVNGGRYAAHVYGRRARQLTQEGASLHGIAIDGHMAVHASPVRVIEAGETPPQRARIRDLLAASSTAAMSRTQRAAPMLVSAGGMLWALADADELATIEQLHVQAEDAPGPRVRAVDTTSAGPAPAAAAMAIAADESWTTGVKTVLVIPVDFPDLTGWPISVPDGNTRTSAALLQERLSNDVAGFFAENSYGRAELELTVADALYRLPEEAASYASTFVGETNLRRDALEAAAQDHDAGAYDVVIVVFSDLSTIADSRIDFEMRAPVGGSYVLINGYPDFGHLARGLGHSYGLWSAQVSEPASVPFEYDGGSGAWQPDPLDVMGSGDSPEMHFNELYKHQLGWIPDDWVGDVDVSGTFRIYRMDTSEPPTGGRVALRLGSRNRLTYWIGYRKPPDISGTPIADGAHVRRIYDSGEAVAYTLDLSPATPNVDVALPAGESVSDAGRGIILRTVRAGVVDGREYIDVEVTLTRGISEVWHWGENARALPTLRNVRSIVADEMGFRALNDDGWMTNWYAPSEAPEDLHTVAAIAADRWDGYWAGAILPDTSVALWNWERDDLAPPEGLTGVHALAIGVYQAVALKQDGTVQAWGRSGPYTDVPAGLDEVVAVEASKRGTCVVRADGTVVMWGYLPAVPGGLDDVVAVSPAQDYVAALRRDGTVVAWGEGLAGLERLLPDVSDARAIEFHDDGGLVLRENGSVVAWSRHATPTPAFTMPRHLPPAVDVAAGMGSSTILAGDGVPVVTVSPASRSIALGGSAAFTTFAVGERALSYRWQRLRPGFIAWANLSDGGSYSGANTPTLRVSAIVESQSGERYRCLVTDTAGESVISGIAQMLAPDALVGIATQPVARSVAEHESVVFSVQPFGESPFKYQWFRDGEPISGATGPRLTLNDVTTAAAGEYHVRVSNSHGAVVSRSVALTITSVAFAGQYLGAFGESGAWALDIGESNTGRCLIWLPEADGLALLAAVSVADDGTFAGDAVPFGVRNGAGSRGVAAVTETTRITGSISAGAARATVDGLAEELTAAKEPEDGPAAAYAGHFEAPFLNAHQGVLHLIVAASGRALVVVGGDGVVLGGLVDLSGAGEFVLADDSGTEIRAGVDPDSLQLRGEISVPESPHVIEVSGIATQVEAVSRIINLSTRGFVGTGDEILIAGFVLAGSGTKPLLIRAIGPTLGSPPFRVAGVVRDPRIHLVRQSDGVRLEGNDNWGDAAGSVELAAAMTRVGAFDLPDGSGDAALLVELPAGAYTVLVEGADAGTGVSLAEVYAVDDAGHTQMRLVNISTRGFAGEGDTVMIPGFVAEGNVPRRLLVRGVGPTLGQEPFNLVGVLADPVITVFHAESSEPVASNDDWDADGGMGETIRQLGQAAGAFDLTAGSADAALIITIPVGIGYTVVVSGKAGASGVVLAEVYEVP